MISQKVEPSARSVPPMTQMEYRRLGRSGIKVSALSFGSWVTFDAQLKDDLAMECMQAAYDAGCNFFDNAEAYAGGESEAIMGRVIEQLGWKRQSYVLSTKVFWGIDGNMRNMRNTLNRKYLHHAIEGCLDRLRVDFVDLLFCHRADPNTPIANGWLRASHRRLDAQKSKPYRPYHPHDRSEPLAPGEIYECDVEIVTSCIVVPAGWRVALTIRGKDYEYEGDLSEFGKKFHYGTRGTGGMTHNDLDNRPPGLFGGRVTVHTGQGRESYLLLPIIPRANGR